MRGDLADALATIGSLTRERMDAERERDTLRAERDRAVANVSVHVEWVGNLSRDLAAANKRVDEVEQELCGAENRLADQHLATLERLITLRRVVNERDDWQKYAITADGLLMEAFDTCEPDKVRAAASTLRADLAAAREREERLWAVLADALDCWDSEGNLSDLVTSRARAALAAAPATEGGE